MNADGYADVVIANAKDSATVFLGSASGTVAASPTVISVACNAATGAGDINGDGISDLIAAEVSYYKIYVYSGSNIGLVVDSPVIITGTSNFGSYIARASDDLVRGASGPAFRAFVRRRRGELSVCLPG